MSQRHPKYPKEEFERRGEELFETQIRSLVSDAAPQDYVAIDIDTGDFEVHADSIRASRNLIARHPDAQIWMRRVGSKVVMRIGGGIRVGAE